MYLLLSYLGLTSEETPNSPETKISNTSTAQRNIAIVLGRLAEKLAGKKKMVKAVFLKAGGFFPPGLLLVVFSPPLSVELYSCLTAGENVKTVPQILNNLPFSNALQECIEAMENFTVHLTSTISNDRKV